VDWISGAFMMFKSSAFRKLGGFDERYFMYCEDVDICLRLQLAGYKLVRADATVTHHTQRRTLKNLQHLVWHVRSLLRLWNSAPYKQYKQRFIDKEA
jgi:N-acetylglucosaminyl-diphospho-decaprenol L-rhamnosyltransferase